jgi:hypothetical protein
VKNKIVREVLDFIRSHHPIYAQIVKEDIKAADESSLERVNLAVFILCKVYCCLELCIKSQFILCFNEINH